MLCVVSILIGRCLVLAIQFYPIYVCRLLASKLDPRMIASPARERLLLGVLAGEAMVGENAWVHTCIVLVHEHSATGE